ncbi:hypothetical protein ACFLW8_06340, partial [Chloroflexota bacterium]
LQVDNSTDVLVCQAGVHQLLNTFNRYFRIEDEKGFTIVIASAVAHCIPGEMLWVRIYGPSRSGKTELLRAIAVHGDSAKMEVITPAAIRGGLEDGHRLLERIDGKLVITKDLASMLTSKRELRNEVFGLMRNVKDGELVSDFGTEEGNVYQQAKFDWLIATTPVFAQYRIMEDLLGSRFIDLKWNATAREEMTLRALGNDANLPMIREEMAVATGRVIDECKTKPIPELDDDTKGLIVTLADLTARLRSPVARDYQHRVKFAPEPEVGTSLAQNLGRITKALMLLDIPDVAPYLIRLCLDSIPYSRIELLSELAKGQVPSTNRNWFEFDDMRLIGICDKTEDGYSLKPDIYHLVKILLTLS